MMKHLTLLHQLNEQTCIKIEYVMPLSLIDVLVQNKLFKV